MLMREHPGHVRTARCCRTTSSGSCSNAAASLPPTRWPTAAALRFYAIGLVGYSTTRIASPVFYALGRSRVPVALSVCLGRPSNLVLSLILVRTMGFRGLALATSMAALVNGDALRSLLLRAQLDGIGGQRWLTVSLAKVAARFAGDVCRRRRL